MKIFLMIAGILIAFAIVGFGLYKLLQYLFKLDIESDQEMTNYKE
jgi:hypothetical protein